MLIKQVLLTIVLGTHLLWTSVCVCLKAVRRSALMDFALFDTLG